MPLPNEDTTPPVMNIYRVMQLSLHGVAFIRVEVIKGKTIFGECFFHWALVVQVYHLFWSKPPCS